MATASQVARELPPEIMAKLSGWHTLTNEVLDLLNTDDLSAAYEVVGRVLAQAQPVTSAWPAEMPAMVVQGKKELLLPPREAKALEALKGAGRALRTVQVGKRVGMPTEKVRPLLANLKARGLVVETKRHRQTFWTMA